MPGPESNHVVTDAENSKTREEKFLIEEFKALIDLDSARNERLDRFLTIFMSLAAAPWALYALAAKDHPENISLLALPPLLSIVFVLTGILGALVAMMYAQVRFNVILYMRAVNAIRDYFLDKETQLSFYLPRDSTKPPYNERGSYVFFAMIGMGLVNSLYVGAGLLGFLNLAYRPGCRVVQITLACLIAAGYWYGHVQYYWNQANKRGQRSDKVPTWGK
jgi:hypothetical protein